MNKEKLSVGPEDRESKPNLEETGKQLEAIRSRLETESRDAETLDVKDHAKKAEKLAAGGETVSKKIEQQKPGPGDDFGYNRQESFLSTMGAIRQDMTVRQRAFSLVIHNKIMERASDIADRTVARPSIMLGAFLVSAVGSFIVYVIAKHNGYAIDSHFVIVALMLAGAIVGLVTELLFKTYRRLKRIF